MTLEEYNYIVDNKLLGACTEEELEQVYLIAFEYDFMSQDDDDKGNLQELEEC